MAESLRIGVKSLVPGIRVGVGPDQSLPSRIVDVAVIHIVAIDETYSDGLGLVHDLFVRSSSPVGWNGRMVAVLEPVLVPILADLGRNEAQV